MEISKISYDQITTLNIENGFFVYRTYSNPFSKNKTIEIMAIISRNIRYGLDEADIKGWVEIGTKKENVNYPKDQFFVHPLENL